MDNYVGLAWWDLGPDISVDEITVRFKGPHQDKLCITYKNEGDGFQADALCQEGYCYQVYMRNNPAPRKYTRGDMGMSPLHARVFSLYDSLKDEYHQCGMDNLYNSASNCRASYLHPKKVLVHGVARKGMRGIPACVRQDEVQNKKNQLLVRGTVKAAVIKGDPDCPNLIA